MKIQSLINSIEEIVNVTIRHQESKLDYKDEVSEIIPEFLKEVYFLGGVAELERRIQLSRKVDVQEIEKGLNTIERYNPQSFEQVLGGENKQTLDPIVLAKEIRTHLHPVSRKKCGSSQAAETLR